MTFNKAKEDSTKKWTWIYGNWNYKLDFNDNTKRMLKDLPELKGYPSGCAFCYYYHKKIGLGCGGCYLGKKSICWGSNDGSIYWQWYKKPTKARAKRILKAVKESVDCTGGTDGS